MNRAIMFTDVKSSSKLWAAHPKEMLKLLTKHEKVIREYTKKYRGEILKTIGDAVMVSFGSLEHAVRCCIEIQTNLKNKPIKFKNSADQIQIRIGLAYGPIQVKRIEIQGHKLKDIFGTTVNLASRMESKVSLVGGFGILADRLPKKILDVIRANCSLVTEVNFKFKCDPVERSARLMSSCVDVAILHVEDGQEHKGLQCSV